MTTKNRYGYLEGIIGIGVNLLLFVLKYWAGIVSGSIALMADAWHTLSDSASSVIVIGSVRLAARKADEKHPFGHGRYQQIAALFIAFMLGVIAYKFFTGAILKLRNQESSHWGILAIVVTACSVVVKEALAQYAYWTYRKTGFESLKADGWHHRSDALSSVLVLAGILAGKKLWWVDGVLGILICLLLFYAVVEIIRSSVDNLLGKKPDEEFIREVNGVIETVTDMEVHPHHFHLHTYGDHKELTFHIMLNGKLDIQSGHRIANDIEEALRTKLDIESTIHVDPLPGKGAV